MHSFPITSFRFPAALRSCLAMAALVAAAGAAAQDPAAIPRYKVNIAPSADLSYAIRARQSGISLEGSAVARWSASGKKYSIANEARAALFGKILDSRSEGDIDDNGLAPASFVEKRVRRDQTTTTFDRQARVIRFSASDQTYPLRGAEQDRNSIVWQLIAAARATPARFKPGSEWVFFVAGQRDADPWTFKVIGQDKIATPLGEVNAVHFAKLPPPDSKEQQVDLWLGPQQEWYPVRLRYTDADGDFIEQTLDQITPKPS
ncbi:DUF3108 domain-containing protein [Noviherbaspirillum galbum]|uniref:DUF3108 domain-containing protein n=1 Tax=Noviherbaspirillum galbum TaxID=2709383 RepID=A0A6B3SXJ7_9BURK|nr:DUF3108 domain-containing protein [Noviherbaspirillum galbum]NEX64295.1 DUF3108 domain-containing protein [Noviherbaspirillum galbum]